MRTPSVDEQVSEELNGVCAEHGRVIAVCGILVAVSVQCERNRPTVQRHFDQWETLCSLGNPMGGDSSVSSEFDVCPVDPAGELPCTRLPGPDF